MIYDIYEVPFHGFLMWQIFCVSLSIPGFHVSMHMAPDTIVSTETEGRIILQEAIIVFMEVIGFPDQSEIIYCSSCCYNS